jgi:hypothetical protein
MMEKPQVNTLVTVVVRGRRFGHEQEGISKDVSERLPSVTYHLMGLLRQEPTEYAKDGCRNTLGKPMGAQRSRETRALPSSGYEQNMLGICTPVLMLLISLPSI